MCGIRGRGEAFVTAAAVELPRGIRINAACPAVLTESLDKYGTSRLRRCARPRCRPRVREIRRRRPYRTRVCPRVMAMPSDESPTFRPAGAAPSRRRPTGGVVERLEALFADAYPRAVAGDGRAGEQCRRLLALMKIIPHRVRTR